MANTSKGKKVLKKVVKSKPKVKKTVTLKKNSLQLDDTFVFGGIKKVKVDGLENFVLSSAILAY